MSSKDSINNELKSLRKEFDLEKKTDISLTPLSIKYLEEKLSNTDDQYEKVEFFRLLSMEYVRYGLNGKATEVYMLRCELFPEDPLSWIALAEHNIWYEENYIDAKVAAEIAIKKANANGKFIRHAYNNLARAAKGQKDYDLLEKTLKKLLTIQNKWGQTPLKEALRMLF
ncbi:MAG: hypothetical protein AB8D52_04135 [Gammaproteobacteria bacterium]